MARSVVCSECGQTFEASSVDEVLLEEARRERLPGTAMEREAAA